MDLQNMDFGELWKCQAEGEKSFYDNEPVENKFKPSNAKIREVWRNYSKKLKSEEKKRPLKLLMVFDEARFLLKTTKDEVSLMRNIRKALNRLQQRMPGFFILFVDTTSRVADFSPSVKDDDSNRHSNPDPVIKLNPPIYAFDTFDVFHENRTVSLSDVGSEESYLCMGRPGWSIFEMEEVPEIAKNKLLHGNQSSKNSYMNGRLASVMCIYAVNLRGSTELASSLDSSQPQDP